MSTKIEEILVKDVMINCDSFPVVNDRELLRETIISGAKVFIAFLLSRKHPELKDDQDQGNFIISY